LQDFTVREEEEEEEEEEATNCMRERERRREKRERGEKRNFYALRKLTASTHVRIQ
jgi:hypothetical protein